MALPTNAPTINYASKSAVGVGSYLYMGGDVWFGFHAGVPSGAGGWAGPGTVIVDITNFDVYMNTGTLATPTWTKKVD